MQRREFLRGLGILGLAGLVPVIPIPEVKPKPFFVTATTRFYTEPGCRYRVSYRIREPGMRCWGAVRKEFLATAEVSAISIAMRGNSTLSDISVVCADDSKSELEMLSCDVSQRAWEC